MDEAERRLLDGSAWRDFCDGLKAVGERLQSDEFPRDPRDRAEGYRALARMVRFATAQELEFSDPLSPTFQRYEEPDSQWGGPNPDNVYLRAAIDPQASYRVRGRVEGVRQAIFSLHEGDMQLGEFGVFGERSLDELVVGADGWLEIVLSPEPQPGNWIAMDAAARLFLIRVYQSDWERDRIPCFHIERIGREGIPRAHADPASVALGLARAGEWVARSTEFWNRYTTSAWERGKANVPMPARTPPGGAENILYGSCAFALGEEEALVLECEEPDAGYWGFSLHTLAWLESGDFAERQTSLSGDQIHVDSDGRVRVVVSEGDPGVPNWIDSEARRRGLVVYRWVWARSNPLPIAKVIPTADVLDALPSDHPRIDAAARRAALARRKRQAWQRFR